ncbi:CRISPR-associated helicase Cas3' [Methylococcus capsulatus]|uniref:CRISPR-associated helicase Cas3' n=1 Tax=Methylococcus capsulatus TaxID=414 RepID=UPI001C52E6D0|nr:CRISPR-associated helicase Cas3' [Methylococcus capsulatus]QXP88313.1 CRISPR-associated helicase Cas3' [Methylococcus capsulatus]QXP94679.1 CRISPR-associated helicase Cas3' [Methylococcus capsulatus]UQN13352.1 CRISPR-associated helicase Cas3' [Methylococcus capsulatus]
MLSHEHVGFWGKIRLGQNGQTDQWLSLSQHSLDVASVFAALAELPAFHHKLKVSSGIELDGIQLQRLAVIALLHDVGKANLGFQDKVFDAKAPRAGHVRELAPLFDAPELCEAFATALDLDEIADWFDPPDSIEQFLLAAWSHHGAPVRFQTGDQTGNYYLARTRWWRADATRDPMQAVAELMRIAKQAFPDAFKRGVARIPGRARLQHRFAGLVMLADWLGSHQAFFPLGRLLDIGFARNAARRALLTVGLDTASLQSDLAQRPTTFKHWFGFEPRPLQSAVDRQAPDDAESRLLIAEAETGSGKTEAALARFFRLFAAGEVDGLYFALPTRVAARELYLRVVNYLEQIFPKPECRPAAVLAVPRYARIDDVPIDKLDRLLPDDRILCHDDPDRLRQERQWAAEHPKRFLAATVAVGTVDQALLSAVQTRHAHLRSVCLDRSLLVVDEVHASDVYMRRLLTGLLSHHVGLGGHAMLLSATLGAWACAEFLQACGCTTLAAENYAGACAAPYPALTLLSGIRRSVGFARGGSVKRVRFDPRSWLKQPERLISELVSALEAGARVLIVLNTVGRANALQRALEQHPAIQKVWLFRCQDSICPHHGRFAPSDRELLDQAVSRRWGKGTPPGPLVLIGTQTLEQSLDIDADWLITDLCPADVLLQRVGRLHRHDCTRPPGFEAPRCTVLMPDCASLAEWLDARGEASREAKRAGFGSVYADLRTLELTRLMLLEQTEVEIPRDNRRLVEGATHPERLATLSGPAWGKHGQNVEGLTLAHNIAAFHVAAQYDRPFGELSFNELNEKARTRLGLDTLRIPLRQPSPGPFGAEIAEITIPGHLAPKERDDETAELIRRGADGMILRYGERHYRYSRFGLEPFDESID